MSVEFHPRRVRLRLAQLKFLSIVLLFTLASSARAGDPNTPRIGPELGPKVKVDRVLKGLPDDEAAQWRSRLASGELSPRDILHKLLVEKVPDYKAAIAAFDKEGTNAEDFVKLEGADAGSLTQTLHAHATYFEGRAHLNRDEFDLACQSFDKLRRELAGSTAWVDEATFYLGYAYARRPELEEDRERLFRMRAKHCFENLAPDFAGQKLDAEDRATYGFVPERDREAAIWLLRELRGEGSGPLLELARRMDTIQRAIDHEHTGKSVQRKEAAVISELDRLIELLREKEQGGGGGGGGGSNGGKKGNKPGGNGGQNAGAPAGRSGLPNSSLQPGQLDKPKVVGSSDWGNLPEHEREAVLQALKEKFPERYKEIVEQYMRSLADDSGARKPTATGSTPPDAKPPEKTVAPPTPPATEKKKDGE